MAEDTSDTKKSVLWEAARANFELMQKAGGSVYEYNPYTRYYLDKQQKPSKEKSKRTMQERLDELKKRHE